MTQPKLGLIVPGADMQSIGGAPPKKVLGIGPAVSLAALGEVFAAQNPGDCNQLTPSGSRTPREILPQES